MKKFLTIAALGIMYLNAPAQETVGINTGDITSPEIHADNTVTFHLLAPNAKTVELSASFLPKEKVKTPLGETERECRAKMTRDKDGKWSYTTNVLWPELHTYSFYVDGIRMNDPNNVYMQRDIATYQSYFLIDGELSQNYIVRDVPHGTVEKVWYPSPTLGMNQRRMTVYLPACYDATSNRSFPVLYLLHGAGGDENAWSELGRATQILDNLIAQGKCAPMIVVMPNGNGAQQAMPGEYQNSMYKPRFNNERCTDGSIETAFVKDVVSYVDSHYRTIRNKDYRAVAGLSMGGFHSLYISANNPDCFSYVGLFSASVNKKGHGENEFIYQNLDQKLKNVFALNPKLYFIAVGNTDFLYNDNVDFRKKLDRIGAKYEYLETDGGHEWRNWRKYLNIFLQKIFR